LVLCRDGLGADGRVGEYRTENLFGDSQTPAASRKWNRFPGDDWRALRFHVEGKTPDMLTAKRIFDRESPDSLTTLTTLE